MLKNKEYFDLKNFSKNSKYHSDDKKTIPGKMKDEYGGTVIYEFAAPKPNSYTVIDENNCEKSVHEGHTSNFKSSEFKDAINNKKVVRHRMKKITSKSQEIYTQDSTKISLYFFDDKRYIFLHGIHTLPYGHKDTPIRN